MTISPRAFFTISLALFSQAASAQVKNHETAGNLESLNNIGCVASTEVKNTYTPADLYRATEVCIRKKDFDRAVFLSAMAGAYARFDAMRVSDPSAGSAQAAVRSKYMDSLSKRQQEAFYKKLSAVASDQNSLASMCQSIKQIGAPAYHPSYMIQHGMQAFSGDSGGPLKKDFSAPSAWQETLTEFLHCP